MPLPLSDYASLIEPAWLAIILPVLLYPLSPWERVRVRGGSHVGLRRLSTNLPIVQVVAERISYVGLRRLSTNLPIVQVVAERISYVGLRRLSTNLPIVQVVAERISYVGLRRLSTNLPIA